MTTVRRPVDVLMIQCGPGEPQVEKNVEQNLALIAEGCRLGKPDFVVLSELSTTQYFAGTNDPRAFDLARPLEGPMVQRFARAAREHDTHVLLTFFEQGAVKGEFFNSVAVLDPAGELVPGTLPDGRRVRCYRKCHIPDQYGYAPGLNERYYFKGGPGLATFDTARGRIGCLICYERSFPEAWRVLALQGAEIVFVPTALWGPNRAASFGLELRAAALQNGVFAVGCNKGGRETTEAERPFYGASAAFGPMADLLAEGPEGKGPALIPVTLDLAEVDRHGVRYTFFRDRRPELYTSLAEVARRVH
jgi:N-carbamoylputrescine amidase